MRVPTYQAQTRRTSAVGGQMMNVQASPSALAAPAAALTDLSNTVFKVAATFAEAEKKAERAAQVSRRTNSMTTAFQDLALSATEQEFETTNGASNYYANGSKLILQGALEGVTDAKVRTQITSDYQTLYDSNRVNFIKTARNKIYDRNTADMLSTAGSLKRQAATGNGIQRAVANDKLFGLGDELGIYDQMADLGYITEVDAVKYKAGARSEIAEIRVDSELAAATVSQSSDDAGAVLLKLLQSDPDFADLDPETRNRLVTKATNLQNALISSENRLADKAEKDAIKKKKQQRDSNFQQLFSKIKNGMGENATQDQINEMPDEAELLRELGSDRLNDKQFEVLSELIKGNDAAVDDGLLITDIRAQIYEGDNEQIKAAIDKAQQNTGPRGRITASSMASLMSLAEQQMADNDSDQAKILADSKQDAKDRASRYRTAVKNMTGFEDPLMGGNDDNKKLRAVDAYNTYNELVEGGVDPKEAFAIVQSNFLAAAQSQLKFIYPSQLVRNVIQKEIKNYTPDDLRTARNLVMNSDMTAAEMEIELETLDLIEREIRELAIRAAAARIESDPETSSSTFSLWDIDTWFGGGDDKRVTD